MKQLLDPKNRTYHLSEFGINLPIGDAIIIGDGNDDLSKFLDKATLERISREDYNKTKPSERLRILEEATANAVDEQSLTDEKKRPELRHFMDGMTPIIYDTNEIVKEQSYRLSAQCASNVAALAASALERNETPDPERGKEQILRYYEKFHPNLRELSKESKESEEESKTTELSSKIGSLGIGAGEKLSPRVRRNLERDEIALAEELEKKDEKISKNWRKYADPKPKSGEHGDGLGLSQRQKEAATQLYRARLEDKQCGVSEEEWIPHNDHSRLLEGVPLALIATHNLLRGISSPTPSARSSRRSSISEEKRPTNISRGVVR
jgi:hypothetical protein